MADNYNVKDAANSTISIAAREASTGVFSPRMTLTHNGTDVSVTNLLPVNATISGTSNVNVTSALPTGTNVIGKFGVQVGGSDVGGTNPVPVRGLIRNPSVTLTLPNSTTTYAVGDLVANSATAGSVSALSWDCGSDSFLITGLTVKSNRTSTTTAGSFRLHLYSAAPTVDSPGGDDADYTAHVNIGSARYLGSIDFNFLTKHKDGHTGAGIPYLRPHVPIKLDSGSTIYGLVEARATYGRSQVSSNSETLAIALDVLPNT